MHAAHELNGPSFAHAILTTDELVAAFGQPLAGANPSRAPRLPSLPLKASPPWLDGFGRRARSSLGQRHRSLPPS